MRKIRTKLVLSLLLITLLPVLPVYFLFQGLVARSLEIGYNKNVETALEQATKISQELFALYKRETLATAIELADRLVSQGDLPDSHWIEDIQTDLAQQAGTSKIDFFDDDGKLVYTASNDSAQVFPEIYQATLRPLLQKKEPEVLDVARDLTHVSAFVPIRSTGAEPGILVLTRALDQEISQGSQHVVSVHQMFRTLNLFEEDLSRGFLLSFVVVYLPIAGLSVGVGYYFSRRITEPLLHLVEGTKKVSAGDWDHRVEANSNDEVGQLVSAFNSMVSTLKTKQDQVIALEKMAAWREIARILAHEIKNPLTPIQLTVQQMKDKYEGKDPDYTRLLEECSDIVSEEIESLRVLVKEFSEFARMPKLNVAKGNLNELVTEVSKLYKDRPVELELDNKLPEFDFDHEKLRRAVINLIENGLDSMHDRPDAKLSVTIARNGESVSLCVQDQGHGIPPEQLERIFEPYFSTKKTGMGLGLAIVKRIVEEHGGGIRVESEPSKGTTFFIKLPII
ncbi:ATP-binding protein [bacterium]|nr:ATP-binding protein [bacterium]